MYTLWSFCEPKCPFSVCSWSANGRGHGQLTVSTAPLQSLLCDQIQGDLIYFQTPIRPGASLHIGHKDFIGFIFKLSSYSEQEEPILWLIAVNHFGIPWYPSVWSNEAVGPCSQYNQVILKASLWRTLTPVQTPICSYMLKSPVVEAQGSPGSRSF